jgi:hypothetical protein
MSPRWLLISVALALRPVVTARRLAVTRERLPTSRPKPSASAPRPGTRLEQHATRGIVDLEGMAHAAATGCAGSPWTGRQPTRRPSPGRARGAIGPGRPRLSTGSVGALAGILEGLVRRADPDGAKRYREVSLSGMAGIDRSSAEAQPTVRLTRPRGNVGSLHGTAGPNPRWEAIGSRTDTERTGAVPKHGADRERGRHLRGAEPVAA